MAPTATPVPPTPTEVPAAPTATPQAMSTLAPDIELGRRYFGQVTLAMVPGRDSDAPAATQFFYQDQIGLHIDGLKQHLRLPFTLRVFNTDTARMVAQVQSDDSCWQRFRSLAWLSWERCGGRFFDSGAFDHNGEQHWGVTNMGDA